jgi:hypothetical protein
MAPSGPVVVVVVDEDVVVDGAGLDLVDVREAVTVGVEALDRGEIVALPEVDTVGIHVRGATGLRRVTRQAGVELRTAGVVPGVELAHVLRRALRRRHQQREAGGAERGRQDGDRSEHPRNEDAPGAGRQRSRFHGGAPSSITVRPQPHVRPL